MSSAPFDSPSSHPSAMRDRSRFSSHASSSMSEVRHADSWIEIPSHPASSSASSVHDEVITHGLRVQQSSSSQRRRQAPLHLSLGHHEQSSAANSSQDEYDESESESDQAMTSSNEDHYPNKHASAFASASGTYIDDVDIMRPATDASSHAHDVFTPQPNAFSHPPSSQTRPPSQAAGSYFPTRPTSTRSASERYASASSGQSRAADHDAALRASLTTLLSCAAAARSLPKSKDGATHAPASQRPAADAHVEPASLRMISASEMNRRRRSPSSQRQSSASPAHSIVSATSDQHKRKATRSSSKERRAVKRLRAVGVDEAISPTLLTWVVSAGVLVLVGALSFSAGYSTGREAGRAESVLSAGGVGDCSRQSRSGLGLRRRLLGGAAQVVSA